MQSVQKFLSNITPPPIAPIANKKTVPHGSSYERNGWTYISVYGEPKERGVAIGTFCAKAFKEIQTLLAFIVYQDTGRKWEFFVDACTRHIKPTIQRDFPEWFQEMEGMAEGCRLAGTKTTVDEIMAWNNYITLLDSWYPNQKTTNSDIRSSSSPGREGGSKDRCSAFIATGSYTKDGKIVMAHNSFTNFVDGQNYNVILDIHPSKGHTILMQTFPCGMWSSTDFFVTSKGIVGSETTIGGFVPYENKSPISCRIRQAMQYGNTLDDYVAILLKENSGDYANSWLLGDIHTNEIMLLELGLKYHDVKRTKDGYFYGCNVAFNPEIRNLECVNTGYSDVRRHQGSRQVRIPDMIEEAKGKLDVESAKTILADHYDVYLNKVNPCSRTICSHYDLDPREYMSDGTRPKPFQPRGAVDGSVIDATMAKNMSFDMRFGNTCGMPFVVKAFCDKHRQWKYLEPYLKDRPTQPWTVFQSKRPAPTRENANANANANANENANANANANENANANANEKSDLMTFTPSPATIRGGMDQRTTRHAQTRQDEASARPNSRAAQSESVLDTYYVAPVISDDVWNDPSLLTARNSARQRIARYPEQREAIESAMDALRRDVHELDAWIEAEDSMARDMAQGVLNANDTHMNRQVRMALQQNRQRRDELTDRINASRNRFLMLLLPITTRVPVPTPAPIPIQDEPLVDVSPPLDIPSDCERDVNASDKYISGISMEELIQGQSVKLSDGHCYNHADIVSYYNNTTQSRRPFISPFSRVPFTAQDIAIVDALKRQMSRGGRRLSRGGRRPSRGGRRPSRGGRRPTLGQKTRTSKRTRTRTSKRRRGLPHRK